MKLLLFSIRRGLLSRFYLCDWDQFVELVTTADALGGFEGDADSFRNGSDGFQVYARVIQSEGQCAGLVAGDEHLLAGSYLCGFYQEFSYAEFGEIVCYLAYIKFGLGGF